MNQAYIDASWQAEGAPSEEWGLGGWGMVLLRPGRLPHRMHGQLQAPDNNAAELRAALEAVRAAPTGEPLTIYTDNQAVIAALARGRTPKLLSELTGEVLAEAQARQIGLWVRYAARQARHMQQAHQLANEARRGSTLSPLPTGLTEVVLEHRPALAYGWVNLRRGVAGGLAERVTTQVPLQQDTERPPSVQLLLAAVAQAQAGETLHIRRASKLAQAMWDSPRRALREALRAELEQAQAWANAQEIRLVFV